MICPHCQCKQCLCVDSRETERYRRRRYQCEGCGRRFTTIETVADAVNKKGPHGNRVVPKGFAEMRREIVRQLREDVENVLRRYDVPEMETELEEEHGS